MLYVGLDLSRKRLDWLALDRQGQPAASVPFRPIATGWQRWRPEWETAPWSR